MAKLSGKFDSATHEWPTPQWLFDELNGEFGFTLDVCATEENAKCDAFFTKEQDGLKQKWSGVCWMNPPYGDQVPVWIKKAIEEMKEGITTVALIPARTNTEWFQDLCLKHGDVRFVRGRPKFGNARTGLPQPLAIVIFRIKKDKHAIHVAKVRAGRIGGSARSDAKSRSSKANGKLGGRPKGSGCKESTRKIPRKS